MDDNNNLRSKNLNNQSLIDVDHTDPSIYFKDIEDQFSLPIYPKRDLVIQKAKNAKIWDTNGKEYIDCAAGIGVASIGHCNDFLIDAID
ncbi:MAG: aminotransferase class III-fold pyridoxal phosphate-dependent enzyme, partial [Candidatus Thorarchaeota archaeon]